MIRLSQLNPSESVPAPPNPNPRHSRTSLRPAETLDITGMLKADPVSIEDILSALESTKPSSNAEFSRYVTKISSIEIIMIRQYYRTFNSSRYEEWQNEYGAV